MKICLIAPRVNFSTQIEDLNDFWAEFQRANPHRDLWSGISTALLTIAALTPAEHDVTFIDNNFQPIDFNERYDLVGISVMTPHVLHAYTIADTFRRLNIPVVLGGIHPTLLPYEAKQHADAIVIGEAEYVWAEVLHDAAGRTLKDFYKSDRVVDLGDSPIPRFDLLKGENYRHLWVQTSRGCPHDCEYCVASKIFGKGFRRKSTRQILAELQLIQTLFPRKPIVFADDNFLAHRESLFPLLKELTGLNIRWTAICDISVGTDDRFLELLRKSGCVFLFIGFESVNEQSLENIDKDNWKYRQSKNYVTYINKIQRNGIGVMGGFMVGLDSDDITVFDHLERFINENHLYHSSVTIITPVPGTRLYSRLESQGRLHTAPWDMYTGYNINFTPAKMTKRELEDGLAALYRKIYSPHIFLQNLDYFKHIYKDIIRKEMALT